MVSRRSFLALLGVALAGLAAWRLFVPSEERRIRKTFDRASRLLAKEGGKSGLSLIIYKYLTDKGIATCRIGMERPII